MKQYRFAFWRASALPQAIARYRQAIVRGSAAFAVDVVTDWNVCATTGREIRKNRREKICAIVAAPPFEAIGH